MKIKLYAVGNEFNPIVVIYQDKWDINYEIIA